MNKQQLASLIWDACNDLRGSISAVEYKDIILGLIFYRFLSEKETAELKKQDWTDQIMAEELNESDTDTIAWCRDHLGYFIAYKNLFSTWKNGPEAFTVSNVTDALNAFVRNIGSNADHQKLYHEIFHSLSEKLSKIGSVSEQTSHLKKVIKVVSRIPMDERQGYDVLGFIYEFLLKNFASNSKKNGEFYTPHEVSVLMSEIIAHHLRDREQISILDPTSGSGSLLINIGQSVQKYLQDSGNITYYAQELIQETYNLTRMNLVMRGVEPTNIHVRRGDTLADDWPCTYDSSKNLWNTVFTDCVASNPPYSHKWEADAHAGDPRYSDYGAAPASKADYAFLLHDLYHLNDSGIMCIVMPHGVLFRGGAEKEIRKALVEHNNLETIIGLPANCFYGTGIATIILVLKKHREASDILIVDASREFVKDGNKNRLSGHHVRKIVDAVLNREPVPHFAALITKDTIRRNDYNLNIPRYVEAEGRTPPDLYATVFGGIPQHELDRLERYWTAFPSLRGEIFTPLNEHTAAVTCRSVSDTIRHNRDVAAFTSDYAEAFHALEQKLCALLIDNKVENVHALKTEITDMLFDLCERFDIVDKYTVYKAFDESWEQISVDLEAIRLQGFDAARSVEDIEVYDKQEKDIVKKGEEGRIIPFALIQKRLFPDDFQRLQSLSQALADAVEKLDSFWAELEEDLKNDLRKEEDGEAEQKESRPDVKRLKARYLEILDALSDEVTGKYDAYLALKPKEKLAYQLAHPELAWPGESEKTAAGVYRPAAIRRLAARHKEEIDLPEEENDWAVRRLYLLLQQVNDLKKQARDLRIALDCKAREKIAVLTDDEIKMLLKEKWLTPAMESINAIPAQIEVELGRSVQQLAEEYRDPVSELGQQIASTQSALSALLGDLTGGQFDMAAVQELIRLLGGA